MVLIARDGAPFRRKLDKRFENSVNVSSRRKAPSVSSSSTKSAQLKGGRSITYECNEILSVRSKKQLRNKKLVEI